MSAQFYHALQLLLSEDPNSVDELKVMVQQAQRTNISLSQLPPSRADSSVPTSTKMKDEGPMRPMSRAANTPVRKVAIIYPQLIP